MSEKNLPIQIFRLSGIYSNKNNLLTRLKTGNVNLINKQNHFFSRIHVEDIARILFKSLSNFKAGEIYNISDDKPSSSEEQTMYGVKLLNLPKPRMIDVKDIESEMLKNFYKDSKKVSNKKMKNFFNYDLKFPTYVEGLNYIRDNLI
jgi:nucleoside-diphosphate-sugar epimerase